MLLDPGAAGAEASGFLQDGDGFVKATLLQTRQAGMPWFWTAGETPPLIGSRSMNVLEGADAFCDQWPV